MTKKELIKAIEHCHDDDLVIIMDSCYGCADIVAVEIAKNQIALIFND